MQTCHTYQIELEGDVHEDQLNATGPVSIQVTRASDDSSTVTVWSDQAAIVGLIRHLHGQGFVVLSVVREGTPGPDEGLP